MFTFVFPWKFRGQPVFTVFSHTYRRRKHGRRVGFVPSDCAMEDLTAEEVGQLLGGN